MTNVCIHGHFYQPPRENPWTGEIELQQSAFPYHDWNERIFDECYKPNSEAQIMNDSGEIVNRVNNFEQISFDFGPTLLGWIRRKHSDTYLKIINADKSSLMQHNGHGNAIAMCYNHMIMPLANFNDKVTQVKWGLADFKYHFGRDSEGIWLPETACNNDTIEVLINEGIKFIVLDPSQAAYFRNIGSQQWIDVKAGGIDPRICYRCYSKINKEEFISIYFYDGPISKAVAFDEILLASQNLLEKVKSAGRESLESQLLSIATDGETFGHHKKFADRTLAHFLQVLAPQNAIKTVNYGEHLSTYGSEFEVMLNTGENDEGKSWSCPHGVKRWEEDCGCGAANGFNQLWRKPLRVALNWLRDQLAVIYEQHGSLFFRDVWKARNEFINVVVNDTQRSRNKFISENSAADLSPNEIDKCFNLLEMQKFAMFMFTSCGWFFSDISGIETVQILEYSARAMELAEKIIGINLEDEFLKRIAEAKSNIKAYGNGRDIYMNQVKKPKT